MSLSQGCCSPYDNASDQQGHELKELLDGLQMAYANEPKVVQIGFAANGKPKNDKLAQVLRTGDTLRPRNSKDIIIGKYPGDASAKGIAAGRINLRITVAKHGV